ncbi:MAG: protease complex subunit PrcB family protein [Armatimonadetes bacterium]|nr:protease complex subunit PrcB family protein [Armatimonadota bacterium]
MTTLIAAALLGPQQHGNVRMFGHFMKTTVVTQAAPGASMDKDLVVARSEAEWKRLREKLGLTSEQDQEWRKLHGPLGALDWKVDQVVFAQAGSRPTGGYQVKDLKVTKSASSESWTVELYVSPPPKDSLNMTMVTYPYTVFRMRKLTGAPRLIVHQNKG